MENESVRQPEEQIARGRWQVQIIRAVGSRHPAAGGPTCRREVRVLLQTPAADILPIHRDRVACMTDVERGRAGRLHHRDERPEPTSKRIIATRHRPAGVVLADGGADGIYPAGAGAATTSDLVPVNGVLLRGADNREQQAE